MMAGVITKCVFHLTLLVLQAHMCYTGHILLASSPMYSHMAQHVAIGEELIKMGHRVSIATAETVSVSKLLGNAKISVERFRPPPSHLPQFFGKDMDDLVHDSVNMSIIQFHNGMTERCLGYCDAMLSDEDFLKRLKSQKVDLVLIDALMFTRCFVLLPKKLEVPFVAETPMPESFLSGAPFWPVAQPNVPMRVLPHQMNFLERLLTVFEMIFLNCVDFPVGGSWLITKHLPHESDNVRYRDLMTESLLWIYGSKDPIFDYPGALMPNSLLVGGLTTNPAKPLHDNLENFMSTAKHGVILFSYGSIAKKIPLMYLQKLLDAFSRLKQNVLMKVHDPSVLQPSANVRLEKWVPQNDVLGHPNTKLFITHCGSNSLYEALYHGVPLLGMPVMPNDQPYNAKKIEHKRWGLWLDLQNFTSDDVVEAVTKLLEDPVYALNMKKASSAFKSKPMTPRKEAAFWIDYVMKNGGDFLRPVSLGMPWWQSLMVDIYSFIIGSLLLTSAIFYWCVRTACNKIRRKTRKASESKKDN